MEGVRIVFGKSAVERNASLCASAAPDVSVDYRGNFRGTGNHDKYPADKVVDDVYEAVDFILRRELGIQYLIAPLNISTSTVDRFLPRTRR